MNNKERFCNIHYLVRAKAGKSQEYMAEQMNISKKTVTNWETGKSSPTFFQSLEWFRILNTNPFPYYMSIVYPESIGELKHLNTDEQIDEAFDDLCKCISTEDKRAMLYLFYGNHGSSPHSVLQLVLAHLHTPMTFRIVNANSVLSTYKVVKDIDEIVCKENIQPDLVDLQESIDRASKSCLNREFSYTSINQIPE